MNRGAALLFTRNPNSAAAHGNSWLGLVRAKFGRDVDLGAYTKGRHALDTTDNLSASTPGHKSLSTPLPSSF